jgi:hypothetical protein
MPAQKRDTKKNFIAILSETTEAQRTVERPAKPDRPSRRGLLGRLAAALNRGGNGKRRA